MFLFGHRQRSVRAFWLLPETSALEEGKAYNREVVIPADLVPRSALEPDELAKVLLAVEPYLNDPTIRPFKWYYPKKVLC